jgi:DNA polymerase-3 subunit delta'
MSLTWPVSGMASQMLERSFKADRLAHAYLFIGPEGSGKKDTAVHFAKMILCESSGDNKPCGICSHCRRIESGNYPDLSVLEPEGQTIKIQQIREIQRSFALKAMESTRKIYIVTKAEQMTQEAANALLKFLEEPATPVVAILLASQKQGLLPTIISRCQIIPFDRVSPAFIQQQLEAEGVPAHKARFLSHIKESLQSAREFSGHERFAEIANLVVQLTEEMNSSRGNPLFLIQEKISKPNWGADEVESFLDCLAWWYRDVLNVQMGFAERIVYENQLARIHSQADLARSENLVQKVETVLSAKKRLQSHANQQLALEHMVLKLQEDIQ